MFEELEYIGLTKTEIKIYVVLLNLGKSLAGVLSRKTGIHRRSIYDALDRLIEKGLVSYIVENGNRYYLPTDPKQIQEIINHQQQGITTIMPQLQAAFLEHKGKQETLFFRGKEGLKTIFEDQINTKEDVFVIGASHMIEERLQFYLPHYTKKRVDAKIKLHLLYGGKQTLPKIPHSKIKFLPKSFKSLTSTNIYGNKVAIILWLSDPVAILINQPDIAYSFKTYFDVLWSVAKQ